MIALNEIAPFCKLTSPPYIAPIASIAKRVRCPWEKAPATTIAGIIADEMAIGMINKKTTAVRIIPVPNKSIGDKVVKKLHPCPSGGTVIGRTVKPTNIRRIVHNLRPGINALRYKIGAVTAYALKIKISRISPQGPSPRIRSGCISII